MRQVLGVVQGGKWVPVVVRRTDSGRRWWGIVDSEGGGTCAGDRNGYGRTKEGDAVGILASLLDKHLKQNWDVNSLRIVY